MNKFSSTFRAACLASLLGLSMVNGCASPVALHRAVLEYDWTVNRIETELLLLNIARMRYHEPIHFTVVSSIAATFDFRVNTGITGALTENPGLNSLSLTLGTSASENPTVSIIPIQGEQFTKRLLTPIVENTIQFLAHQGIDPAILLRLMARGIILEDKEGHRRFLLNQPHRKEEYREFRQRVMHVSWLQFARHLFIGPLQFQEGGEQKIGRMAITNYDPDSLPNGEREALNIKAERFPLNHILVDIRPGYPGGDFPLQGEIHLRSFKGIIGFIGRGIVQDQEFHVDPDPRTPYVLVNPDQTLIIQESKTQPKEAIFSAKKRGLWYYIEEESTTSELEDRWNHEAFDILYQLYHLTVTDLSQTPTVPITIAK
jgi:hypothetical protein